MRFDDVISETKPTRWRGGSTILLVLLCLFPFLFLLVLSTAAEWRYPALWPQRVSFDLWTRMLTGSGALVESFLLSTGISLIVALVSTLAGYITGKYIAYHRHRRVLLFLAYVPFIMSPVILGTCLMYLYIKTNLTGNALGVIVSQTMFAYGFSIVFFSAFWTHTTKALEDLVYTLGGTVRQAYERVLLPISRSALLVCFFQTFLISWFQYGLTILIGSGKVQTLPVKVYEYIGEANMYYAALASCLLIIPPALLLLINKRFVFKPV